MAGLRTTLEELGIVDDVESGVVKHQNEELEAPCVSNHKALPTNEIYQKALQRIRVFDNDTAAEAFEDRGASRKRQQALA